jgi:hypothetical protein
MHAGEAVAWEMHNPRVAHHYQGPAIVGGCRLSSIHSSFRSWCCCVLRGDVCVRRFLGRRVPDVPDCRRTALCFTITSLTDIAKTYCQLPQPAAEAWPVAA